jgi:hypothetical protein
LPDCAVAQGSAGPAAHWSFVPAGSIVQPLGHAIVDWVTPFWQS